MARVAVAAAVGLLLKRQCIVERDVILYIHLLMNNCSHLMKANGLSGCSLAFVLVPPSEPSSDPFPPSGCSPKVFPPPVPTPELFPLPVPTPEPLWHASQSTIACNWKFWKVFKHKHIIVSTKIISKYIKYELSSAHFHSHSQRFLLIKGNHAV